MASNYVDTGAEDKIDGHRQIMSPRQGSSPRTIKRTWPSNSSTCSQGTPPKCVCAPATHPNSFKCRFHRTQAQQNSPSSPPPVEDPPEVVSNSSTHQTVKAV